MEAFAALSYEPLCLCGPELICDLENSKFLLSFRSSLPQQSEIIHYKTWLNCPLGVIVRLVSTILVEIHLYSPPSKGLLRPVL